MHFSNSQYRRGHVTTRKADLDLDSDEGTLDA